MKITHLVSPKTHSRYSLSSGLTKSLIQDLLAFTHNEPDPFVRATTSDWRGGQGRFGSLANFARWVGQGRTIYSLVSQDAHLAGIIWFGERQIPSARFLLPPDLDTSRYGLTFGIRLYGSARGAGLATTFARRSLTHFTGLPAYFAVKAKGIWLETSADNAASIALASKLGAKRLASSFGDRGRALLVFPISP